MPSVQSPSFNVHDKLVDREGNSWIVLNVHPPVGRRGVLYTVLDVAGEFAYLFDSHDCDDLGLNKAD